MTAKWKIEKNNIESIICFEGYDEYKVFDFNQSFGCYIESNKAIALYLPKRKPKNFRPKSLESWENELNQLFTEIEGLV